MIWFLIPSFSVSFTGCLVTCVHMASASEVKDFDPPVAPFNESTDQEPDLQNPRYLHICIFKSIQGFKKRLKIHDILYTFQMVSFNVLYYKTL